MKNKLSSPAFKESIHKKIPFKTHYINFRNPIFGSILLTHETETSNTYAKIKYTFSYYLCNP